MCEPDEPSAAELTRFAGFAAMGGAHVQVARDEQDTQSGNAVHDSRPSPGGNVMLYTIAVILVILWLLGMVTSYTMSGLVHILLVIAIVVVLLRVIQGRRPI